MKLFFRGAARRILSATGLQIRLTSEPVPIYDVLEIDLVEPAIRDLAFRLGRKPKVVQVGASDGKSEDPLYQLIKDDLVDAVLVEPLPESFAKLQALHKDRQNVRLKNCAVSLGPSELEIYCIREPSGRIRYSPVSSFDRDLVERHMNAMKSANVDENTDGLYLDSITCPALTVKEVISEAGWANADALIVDAEGLDHEIVLGSLEAGLEFDLVFLEVFFVSLRDYPSLIRKFAEYGYGSARSGKDLLLAKKLKPNS